MMESGSVVNRFGKFHIINFFLTCLPAIFDAASNVNFVLVASDINYRCRVPQCEEPNGDFMPSWWPISVHRCWKPVLNTTFHGSCSNSSFTSAQEVCTEWIYETNNSVIAELDLACQPLKSNMIGTIHNIAMAMSMFLSGRLADWLGRRPIMIFCSTSLFIGVFKTFATSYTVYATLEFFEALGSGGIITVGLVTMIEVANKKNRLLAGVLFGYSIYLGEVLFAGLSMLVPFWKHLFYVIYTPTILFLLYIPLTNETLRWLIVHEKVDEAKKLVKTIVKMNKIDISPQYIENMDLEQLRKDCDVETVTVSTEGYIEAFKCFEITKRFLICTICRFSVVFIYYGLTFNSVALPGNQNMNFLLTSLISFPGDLLCLLLMNRFGRRIPLIIGYLMCGLICILFALIPEDITWLKITVYLSAKLVVAACYTGIVTFIMELFPTSVRGSMLGLCVIFASLGTTLAPLTPALSQLAMSVSFGSSAIISSLLLFFVPETNNKQLVDTVEQLKAMTNAKKASGLRYKNGQNNYGFDNYNGAG